MLKEHVRKFAKGLSKVACCTTIPTIIDFLYDGSINAPLADIAIGSGMATGYCVAADDDNSGILVSLVTFAGSMLPYLILSQQSGNYSFLTEKISLKALEYVVPMAYSAITTNRFKSPILDYIW